MTAVLNIVELPVPIDAKPDVLGTRSRVTIGEHRGEICAPTLGEASYREAFAELHPPRVQGVGNLIRVFNHGARDPFEEVRWGMPTVWSRGRSAVRLAHITALVLRIFVDDPPIEETAQRVGEEIMQSFNPWFAQFLKWIEVLATQDLDITSPYDGWIEKGLGLTHPWVIPEGGSLTYTYVNRPVIGVMPSEETAVSKAQWKRSIKAANAALEIPGPHLLMRDARAAFIRSGYRKAVIDTGTAVELTLSELLQEHLSHDMNGGVVDEILSRVRNFRDRQRLARKLGIRLPENLYKLVAEPRNDVLHRNQTPSRDVTRAAIAAGGAVVRKHLPLPWP